VLFKNKGDGNKAHAACEWRLAVVSDAKITTG